MKIPFYIVNAFDKKPFSGNPTGVCILEEWLSTDDLKQIASQNGISETVFLFPSGSNAWSIRWFSPIVEKEISGHGAMAAAHILFTEGFSNSNRLVRFSSNGGQLSVSQIEQGFLRLEMNSLKARSSIASPLLIEGLGAYPDEVFLGLDCLCVFSDESIVSELQPEHRIIKRISSARGIIVTARSSEKELDYVTRFFAPRIGVDEDQANGSIHGLLVPYWSRKLGKEKMFTKQLSPRGASIECGLIEERIWLEGYNETFLRGEISL